MSTKINPHPEIDNCVCKPCQEYHLKEYRRLYALKAAKDRRQARRAKAAKTTQTQPIEEEEEEICNEAIEREVKRGGITPVRFNTNLASSSEEAAYNKALDRAVDRELCL